MYNENGDNMKRGFTLAELLGVTVLLALVCALAYPALFGIFEDEQGKIDSSKKELITAASINYAKSNLNDYPYKEGQNACVFLKTLVDQNLIGYEVEEDLYDRIIQINMGVNSQYKADILGVGETCTAYGTTVYRVSTCTKNASTYRYSLTDNRTMYYIGDELVKQVDIIKGENDSDLSSFKIQANNYETLSNTLKYHDGISTQMNKGESYFKMRIEFDMHVFDGFYEDELPALQNAPIFLDTASSTLENTCSE